MRRRTGSVLRVFNSLRLQPLSTINRIQAETGLSYPTVAKCIEVLSELGIVQEVTGRKRNRIYAYQQYVHILSEGAEPL